MPNLDITAPDGTVYHWNKPTPPTQGDLDALTAFHAKTHPGGKRLGANGDPLGDPADEAGYVAPPPVSNQPVPAGPQPSILIPAGAAPAPRVAGRVRDVPRGTTPMHDARADDVRAALDSAIHLGGLIPDSPTPALPAVLAPDHPAVAAERAQKLPFDLATLSANAKGKATPKTIPANQITFEHFGVKPKGSPVVSDGQPGIDTMHAARLAAIALGLTRDKELGFDTGRFTNAHDEAVARNILNPKSDTYRKMRRVVAYGGGGGAPASQADLARQSGAGPVQAAIIANNPGIKDASNAELYGMGAEAVMAPISKGRVLTGDARTQEELTPDQRVRNTVGDLLAFGGIAGLAEKAVASVGGVAVRTAAREILGRTATAKIVQGAVDKASQTVVADAYRAGLRRVATSTFGNAAIKLGTASAGAAGKGAGILTENAALQALPMLGRAQTLTEHNGESYWKNLRTVADEEGPGLVRPFDPRTLWDPNATPEEKAMAAITQGMYLFGLGAKGFDWAMKRAHDAGIDPRIVEHFVNEGRREAQGRAGVGRAVAPPEAAPPSPEVTLGRTAPLSDASGLRPADPLADLSYAREPAPPEYGLNGKPHVTKSGPVGEPPALLGDRGAEPSILMPNGEPLIRNDADRSRLAAMVEEFGPEEGHGRFVADRMDSKGSVQSNHPLITGDEMSRAEHDALSRKVDRMKADRAALDEAPTLPKNVRDSLVRSIDPDADRLDPFSDHYDDGLAATLHTVLFGEHPPRGRDGDVSEAAVSRVRDELRAEQQAAYSRETLAENAANPEDADHVRDLALRSRAVRDPETTKDFVPDVDERDVPDSPEDWITAKRANNRRGWKVNRRKINMVGIEGVHPETARALVDHALSKESDGSFLRRSDYDKYKRAGIKPTFRKLSELIEKEVGGDWRRPDFDGWSRIQIPRSVVTDYVRGRLSEQGMAQDLLKSIAPHLSEQEISNVIEFHAQGRELPRDPRGDGDAPSDRGQDRSESGNDPQGDRGSGRPKSPRQPARERLDAEISATEARLMRARVVEGASPTILRPGQVEGEAKPLVGPGGEPFRRPKREAVKVREASRAAPKIEVAPSTARKASPEPEVITKAEKLKAAEVERKAPNPEREASKVSENPPKAERSAEKPTETRNADTEKERAEAGTAPVERQDFTTKAQADEAGRKSVKAGRNFEALAEAIASKPRPITAIENGVLKAGRQKLFEQAREAVANRREAQGKGDLEGAAEHHQEYLRVRALIDRNTEALVKGGRELSSAFGARRGEESVDLADPEAVVQEARWTKGDGDAPAEIDPKTEARMRKMADDLAELERQRGTEAQARARAEAALARLKEERSAARAERKVDLQAEMTTLKRDLTKALSSTANSGLPVEAIAVVAKMARNAVQQGALTLAEVIDHVRTNLPDEAVDMVEDRDILDALSGYGRAGAPKETTPADARLAELKRLARATSDIEDATAGHRDPARPKLAVSDELAAMRKVRDELRKEKGLDRKTIRVRKAVEDVVAALEKREAEVKAATGRGERVGTTPRPAEDPAVATARANLRTALSKNRTAATIRDLEAQIASGKFDTPSKRPLPDKETQELNYRRDQLRREIRGLIEAQKPKTAVQKVGGVVMETAGAVRTLKTSFDLSAALRQGAMLTLANPKQAYRAFGEQIRAFKDPAYAHAANEAILRGPHAEGYAQAGLYLSDPDAGSLNAHEEGFVSKMAGKIPGVGASERAYTAYLNTMRADVFQKLTEGRNLSLDERKAIANYINIATGRGHLPGFEKASGSLAQILFSPRYLTSRFEILTGQPLWSGSARTRGIIAKEYAKYGGAVLAVVMLAKARGATVSTDPENPDYLKIKFGNTRIDVLSGLQQALRFALRMGSGKTDGMRVASQFARFKLAPAPGTLVSLKLGKDPVGKKFGLKEAAVDTITPMLWSDTREAMEAQGIPKGLALGVLSALGGGVSSYKPK